MAKHHIQKYHKLYSIVGIDEISDLKGIYQTASTAYCSMNSLLAEGILNHALTHKVPAIAKTIIDGVLEELAADIYSEAFIQPALLTAARAKQT